MADDILIATDSVLTNFDGREIYIVAGQTTVRAGHPLLEGREGLFQPLKVAYDLGDDVPGKVIPTESLVDATADPAAAPEDDSADADESEDGLPRGNASRDEWAAYAVAHGLTAEEVEPLSRDEIRAHFAEA